MKCCLFQLFSLALEGSQFWLILIFATCLYTVWSHKVALVTHTFLLIFCGFCSWPAGFDLWCDWAFSLTSFETYSDFFSVAAKQPLIEVLGSPQTPAQPSTTFLSQTYPIILYFPNYGNLTLTAGLFNNYSVCMKHWQSFMTSTKC